MTEGEFLTPEELAELTGYKHPASQREWLERNGWNYVPNAARRPIVGRLYARQKLSGITPTAAGPQSAWTPDFSALQRPAVR